MLVHSAGSKDSFLLPVFSANYMYLSNQDKKGFSNFVQEHKEAFIKLKYADQNGMSKIDSVRLMFKIIDKLIEFIGSILILTPLQKSELRERYTIELQKIIASGNLDTIHLSLISITISLLAEVLKMKISKNECGNTIS